MCIRSLSKMAIKLHELSIEGRTNAISHGIFSRASPQDYNHLLNVFAYLYRISVNFNTNHGKDLLNFAGLGRLLTHATMLQSLDLKCTDWQHHPLKLSRVFQNATWPRLKHFGLHGFTMYTDVELIAFFDRHRATLASVALKSMFLHQKDFNSTDASPCEAWKHLFGELRKRSIKFQVLNLFRIHDCYNWEGKHPTLAIRVNCGESVLRYLRDGGPNPLTSQIIDQASV